MDFAPYPENCQNRCSNFAHLFMLMPSFFFQVVLLHWGYNQHLMDACLGTLETKCLSEGQLLNNRFFFSSVKDECSSLLFLQENFESF